MNFDESTQFVITRER